MRMRAIKFLAVLATSVPIEGQSQLQASYLLNEGEVLIVIMLIN